MWDAALPFVRFSDSVNKFVPEEQVLLEFYVGVQNVPGKTKQVKKAVEKGAENLIETFLDVRHSADIRDVLNVGFFQLQSSEVPCVHGTFPRDSCINAVKVSIYIYIYISIDISIEISMDISVDISMDILHPCGRGP